MPLDLSTRSFAATGPAPVATPAMARVNGVVLHLAQEQPGAEELRQRACSELLRQAAQAAGLLSRDDVPCGNGVISEAASAAIESLLEDRLRQQEPSEEACRRHFLANEARYRVGERVRARHILFAVTPGVDVVALRGRAEAALLEVRCHAGAAHGGTADIFARVAGELSNCPSAAQGGDLGWLREEDCAPEFARELFAHAEVGVLPRLVHSRFGLHVVEVLQREPGAASTFDAVRGAVSLSLRRKAYVTALRQYLRLLAGEAVIEGVELEGAQSPLLQ